ncbi:hypothetical protein Vau01_107760 [Virgisporangium aurantiacum]|uniref:Uncharacterized protein n=1 Tax=Virgisporangium aurantiacum TaxID=175570 RepID=A0A8J3ZKS4_9ACTN|nr:hypothetical protein Vau01_107760 [Virgisporangium aurantiacum]
MTLRFTGTGYRALPQPKRLEIWGDRLLGDATTGISLIVLIVFGGLAAYLWQEDAKPVSVLLLVICVPCLLVLLARAAIESVGWLFLAAAVVGAVLFAPLLLFPGARRWATQWWKKKPAESHLDKRIRVTDLEPVSVERNGRAVTVTVLIDGARIRYTARDGDALEREFRAMLSRPATGVGP